MELLEEFRIELLGKSVEKFMDKLVEDIVGGTSGEIPGDNTRGIF